MANIENPSDFDLKVFGRQLISARRRWPIISWRAASTTFKSTDLQVELNKQPKKKPAVSELLFEGMKAYRGEDNQVRLFRPMMNMERMHRTAHRACLPAFDRAELLECLRRLIDIDREWVPKSTTASLYIRPTFIGTEPSLGVTKSNHALLYIILGPVGPYFPTGGFTPVSLLADPKYVRAWTGGVGNYKLGGNYGPTIYVQNAASKEGCQQVLWLYGNDHQVTEAGTMNFFIEGTCDSTIKRFNPPWSNETKSAGPGATGEFKVSERTFTMADVLKGLKDNRVKEIFGAGTACVVCPVNRIFYDGENYLIPTMENGPDIAKRFLKELTDIQFSRIIEHVPIIIYAAVHVCMLFADRLFAKKKKVKETCPFEIRVKSKSMGL
ncbi:unnamed protein product [Ranitomeya imitator]|uniref:Branched-chain-amino-acid aminotransferase, mitochondrial n=1 Tax=Ranitomeya imitator TaxID=111125 RepID=A0ABN9LWR5_9NEOB|nr:unnamed protein product [Ranitomeya imitator]